MLQPADDADGRTAVIDLGQVALHPNDQPATFLLRVPAAWANEAAGAVLVVSIVHRAGDRALDGQAAVRAVWMREPK